MFQFYFEWGELNSGITGTVAGIIFLKLVNGIFFKGSC